MFWNKQIFELLAILYFLAYNKKHIHEHSLEFKPWQVKIMTHDPSHSAQAVFLNLRTTWKIARFFPFTKPLLFTKKQFPFIAYKLMLLHKDYMWGRCRQGDTLDNHRTVTCRFPASWKCTSQTQNKAKNKFSRARDSYVTRRRGRKYIKMLILFVVFYNEKRYYIFYVWLYGARYYELYLIIHSVIRIRHLWSTLSFIDSKVKFIR